MKTFRYLDDVATLNLNRALCVGCSLCVTVCPHRIFDLQDGKARLTDRDSCMECGACARNCPTGAITVTPGVGCASLIIQTWIPKGLRNRKKSCC